MNDSETRKARAMMCFCGGVTNHVTNSVHIVCFHGRTLETFTTTTTTTTTISRDATLLRLIYYTFIFVLSSFSLYFSLHHWRLGNVLGAFPQDTKGGRPLDAQLVLGGRSNVK